MPILRPACWVTSAIVVLESPFLAMHLMVACISCSAPCLLGHGAWGVIRFGVNRCHSASPELKAELRRSLRC